ncbi:hypothetical protein MTO96_025093 [Rhipicephalus appendiculatus]
MRALYRALAVLSAQLFLPCHVTTNKYERNKACLKPPTKVNCTTVEYKWSFIDELNGCYQTEVCSDHINNFEDKFKCARACPPHWRPLPPRCREWKNKLYVYDPWTKTCEEIRSCFACARV